MADMCAGSPVPPPLPPPRPSRMATQCHYHRHRPAAAFVWVTIVLLASSALVAAQSSSSAPAAPAVVDSIPYYAISLRSSASSSQDIHFGLQLPLAGSSLTTNADPTYWVARYAAQYGLERALANGLLPNANITLHVADTFHGTNPDATAARAADLLIAKGVVGVIGDGTSAQTIASAGIMSLYNIPICSPFASKDQLSNKKLYPSFYRTLTSVEVFADSFVSFLIAMGWNRVGMYYSEQNQASVLKFRAITSAAVSRNVVTTFQALQGDGGMSGVCNQLRQTDTRILLAQVSDGVDLLSKLEGCDFFDGEHVLVYVGNFNLTTSTWMASSPRANLYLNASSQILQVDLIPSPYAFMADQFISQLSNTSFPFTAVGYTPDQIESEAANIDYTIGCAYSMVAGWDTYIKRTMSQAARGGGRPQSLGGTFPLNIKLSDFNMSLIENTTLELTKDGNWVPEHFAIRGVSYNTTDLSVDMIDFATLGTANRSLTQIAPWAFLTGTDIPLDGPKPQLGNLVWSSAGGIVMASIAGIGAFMTLGVGTWMLYHPLPDIPRTTTIMLLVAATLMFFEFYMVQGVPNQLQCAIRDGTLEVGFGLATCAAYIWLRARYLVFDTGRPVADTRIKCIGFSVLCIGFYLAKLFNHFPAVWVTEQLLSGGQVRYVACTADWADPAYSSIVAVTAFFYLAIGLNGIYMASKMRRVSPTAARMGIFLVSALLGSVSIPILVVLTVPLVEQFRALFIACAVPVIIYAPAFMVLLRKLTCRPIRARHNPWVSFSKSGRGTAASTGNASSYLNTSKPQPPSSAAADQVVVALDTKPANQVQRRAVQQWTVPYAVKWASGLGAVFGRRTPAQARVLLTRKIVTIEWRDKVFSEHVGAVVVRRVSKPLVADPLSAHPFRARSGSLGSLFRGMDRRPGPSAPSQAVGPPFATARSRARSAGANDMLANSPWRTEAFELSPRALHTPPPPFAAALPPPRDPDFDVHDDGDDHDDDDEGTAVNGDVESPTTSRAPSRGLIPPPAPLLPLNMPTSYYCVRVESLLWSFFLQFNSEHDMRTFCIGMKDQGCNGIWVASGTGSTGAAGAVPSSTAPHFGRAPAPSRQPPLARIPPMSAATSPSGLAPIRRSSLGQTSMTAGPVQHRGGMAHGRNSIDDDIFVSD